MRLERPFVHGVQRGLRTIGQMQLAEDIAHMRVATMCAFCDTLLAVIELIGRDTSEPYARLSLRHQVQLIEAESQSGRLIDQDRRAIHLQAEALQMSLQLAQN